jgi:hypothetical protein
MTAGIVLCRIGLSITGQEERFSGTASYGNVVLHRNPAIEGSAKSWLGRLVAQMLRLCGSVLFLTGLLALTNVSRTGAPSVLSQKYVSRAVRFFARWNLPWQSIETV